MPRKSKGLIEVEALLAHKRRTLAEINTIIEDKGVEIEILHDSIEELERLAASMQPKPRGAKNANV